MENLERIVLKAGGTLKVRNIYFIADSINFFDTIRNHCVSKHTGPKHARHFMQREGPASPGYVMITNLIQKVYTFIF